ncbi:MAG TPA: NgoMIV family type II restriction endonuclease [Solirubrobacterales bacterium]|nr:NgoMIV family type II restriction endonuclease [Solirubrobacterales bacterium]
MKGPDLRSLRDEFHREICRTALSVRAERSVREVPTPVYSNADKHSEISVDLGARVAKRLPPAEGPLAMKGQQLGRAFEHAVMRFVSPALSLFPAFTSKRMRVEPGRVISHFAQFAHLAEIQALVKENPELEATLGGDYLVDPDLVVSWDPFEDRALSPAVDPHGPPETLSPVRLNSPGTGLPLLHATISCKWTLRSDRAQNIRTEALNLVRNRKGRTPHIVAVTMEPDPKRLAAIAIGTGDVDCVYHGALYELREAAEEAAEESVGRENAAHRLEMMVRSSRLRDISDLPLDLLI